MRERSQPPIDVATDPTGTAVYYVRRSPNELPPVRSRDLAESWDVARQAASASAWGQPCRIRFQEDGAEPVDLTLADADACCWAAAVDAAWGLQTPYGLSLCLRLLGLVTLLSESLALRALCPLTPAGAHLDPALVRVAASIPLSPRGGLDERRVREHLASTLPALPPPLASGARC